MSWTSLALIRVLNKKTIGEGNNILIVDFHEAHLTDFLLTKNPRSLISFQSKCFFARKMSEKGKAVAPTNYYGVFCGQRYFRSAADTAALFINLM